MGDSPSPSDARNPYTEPLMTTIILQGVLGVLAAMNLDFGQLFQYWWFSALAFWVSVGMLIHRARSKPTKFDLFYIKWGFFVALALVYPVTAFVWRLRGVEPP